MTQLRQEVFKQFADLIYKEAGIHLGDHKQALVSARLGKRMRFLRIGDFDEYYDYVQNDQSRKELGNLLDVISTNVTCFYREPGHFEILKSLVRQWAEERQTRFRIWSAACSTGEEPYSMALTLSEALPGTGDVKILATDISTSVLTAARQGEYKAKKLEKMSRKMIEKYFNLVQSRGEKVYRIKDQIKKMIQFSWLNLSTPPYPMKGPLDVIFCRNVMIYFDNRVKERLLEDVPAAQTWRVFDGWACREPAGLLSRFKSVKPQYI